MVTSSLLAACAAVAVEVPVVDGRPPEWIKIMPMGENRTRNGVPPVVILADRMHAEAVVAASDAYLGKTDMVIDYDHQTVRAPAVAGKAPAAGWTNELQVRDDGIWARSEWTAEGSADIVAKRYRYISPYFAYRPDGRVTKIINVGLTNTPNLDLAAIASALSQQEGTSMKDLKAIASALGLGDDADEAAILAAIAALNAGKTVLSATASALGAKDGDDLVALASTAVAQAAKPDPAKFVPISVVTELRAEMSALSAKVDQAGVESKKKLIDDAVAAGRLTPALRKHAETLEMTALASFLDALPENGLGKAIVSGGKADDQTGADGLTEDDRAVASALGMSGEEFAKAKKQQEAN